MSIKLPRVVKVGPVMFSVRKCKRTGEKGTAWGTANYTKARINIKGSLPVQHQAVTLIHEMTHAMLTAAGRSDLADEEVFVERFAETLTDTLWNSPGLLRYLREAKR